MTTTTTKPLTTLAVEIFDTNLSVQPTLSPVFECHSVESFEEFVQFYADLVAKNTRIVVRLTGLAKSEPVAYAVVGSERIFIKFD